MAALLQLADVSLISGQTRVLDHLDFAMEQGEIHALLGANGCGKSSLAFMVMGCQGYAPSSGSVRFAGGSCRTLSRTFVRPLRPERVRSCLNCD